MNERGDGQGERRVAERIDTGGRLPSQFALDMDTSVVQISAGGMMIEVPMPLAIGSKHGFTISIGTEELALNGMVRNCRSVDSAVQGGQSVPSMPSMKDRFFCVGIEFCDLNEKQARFLDDFVIRKRGT
jgi:hypothetical protein